jgi:GxxExxY protein
MLEHEALTNEVLAAAIEVHQILGPGLLESCYEQCPCHELTLRGISFRRQVDCPVEYKGLKLECGFRIDILVNGIVVLELKAVEKLNSVHEAQLITYMKLAHKKVGFLLNFNARLMKDGIVRRVL